MYSRQNRNGQPEISVELPRDYSGNAFSPFSRHQEPPLRNQRQQPPCEVKREEEAAECVSPPAPVETCAEENECARAEPIPCPQQKSPFSALSGLKSIFGGNIGLEELLLLGVIFLIFSDNDLRDNELLICLLLILFI